MSDGAWKSKLDAEVPIDDDPNVYMTALQRFYDNVYVPSATKPTDAKVEEFLKSADAQGPDTAPLRRLIVSSFSIQRTTTAAAREEGQVKFQPTKAIQPSNAVDPLARDEKPYEPEDSRMGDVSEGVYAPIEQQDRPRNTGEWDDKSASWTNAQFASVCPCAKNVG